MKDEITISRLIKKKGLKKKFIAEKCGMSPSQLSHILSGERKYPEFRRILLRFLSL